MANVLETLLWPTAAILPFVSIQKVEKRSSIWRSPAGVPQLKKKPPSTGWLAAYRIRMNPLDDEAAP